MGLDSVELLMSTEDAFQIHITDEEANKILTVGDLYNLIINKIEVQEHNRKSCLTSAAFYRIRRALCEVMNLRRGDIRPATNLSSIVPLKRRRHNWKRFQDEVGLNKVPGLYPHFGLIAVSAVAICMVPRLVGVEFSILELFFLFFIALIFSAVFYMKCAPILALTLPSTVGSLAEIVALTNARQLAEEMGGLNKKEVWEIVSKIVIEHLGVKPEQVTTEARFVQDLDMS